MKMMMMKMMMCRTLTLLLVCMALQEGRGLPLSERADRPQVHVRTKRCSCSSWDDRECVYFCHLDIIWVNTPSKLLPYGLGSPLSRRRRSTERCQCLNPEDESCSGFCRKSSETSSVDVWRPSRSTNSKKLLESLKAVVTSNTSTVKKTLLAKKELVRVDRMRRSKTRR